MVSSMNNTMINNSMYNNNNFYIMHFYIMPIEGYMMIICIILTIIALFINKKE